MGTRERRGVLTSLAITFKDAGLMARDTPNDGRNIKSASNNDKKGTA